MMRWQGQADEVIAKYLERAQDMLDRGRPMDAVAWLREVLTIDESRTDVARLVRDLCYQEGDEKKRTRVRIRAILWSLALLTLISLGVMRELRVRSEYRELAGREGSALEEFRARLARVEEFARAYPAWHGALEVRREESFLRGEIARLDAEEQLVADNAMRAAEARELVIESIHERGLQAASSGDFAGALAAFEQVLEMAGPEWSKRERTMNDAQVIREYLKETR